MIDPQAAIYRVVTESGAVCESWIVESCSTLLLGVGLVYLFCCTELMTRFTRPSFAPSLTTATMPDDRYGMYVFPRSEAAASETTLFIPPILSDCIEGSDDLPHVPRTGYRLSRSILWQSRRLNGRICDHPDPVASAPTMACCWAWTLVRKGLQDAQARP